jgi:cyclophilin family peptidyl-prolyl cis-trans isomerase
MRFCWLLALAISLVTLRPALAAGDKEPVAPELEAFTKQYAEWKKMVARLYQVQELYRSDPAANKTALQAEYTSILDKAQIVLPGVTETAEKAYLAAPNQNKELEGFLMTNMTGYVLQNDFEKAAHLGKILTDHKFEAQELNLLTGLALFATNDFDNAEKFLKLASESKIISQMGQRQLGMIPKYKEMWAKEAALREAEAKAKDLPRVKLTTTKGDIVVELFENQAPIATANFISLVEKKFYDGLNFHRVLGDFMAQGGDPKGDGTGGPGYTIPCECYQDNHRDHFRGSLSMANTGKRDSGGSQFFLTFAPTPHLDGKHTVFGRVVDGIDVLAKLQRCKPGDNAKPDKIVKATVLSKRPHPYVPVTRPDK